MPADTPFVVVPTGPRFTPLRFGLLAAAQIVDDPDPHWRNGTKFQPDACDETKSTAAFCVAGGPATGTPAKFPTSTGAPMSAAEPFTVYAFTDCAPVGWGDQLEDLRARAERQLDSGEGRAVERVFWTGAVSPSGGPAVHPHLAADTEVLATADGPVTVELQSAAVEIGSTAVSPKLAISALEGALGDCYGGEGVIHVPRRALPLLEDVVHEKGTQLRTMGGNIIAAYSADAGTAPDGAPPASGGGSWFYATGAVVARRSPILPTGRRPAEFVGRTDNSTVYVVERTYVIDWDCCHFAIEVTGLGP